LDMAPQPWICATRKNYWIKTHPPSRRPAQIPFHTSGDAVSLLELQIYHTARLVAA
jgi:hypothetical protein